MLESRREENMGPEKVAKISQNIVSFLLKNKKTNEALKSLIGVYCPELKILTNHDEKLSEEYTSTMIVHKLPGLPFPKEDSDSFISDMLSETKLSNADFIKWLEKIKSNKKSGLHFGIKNPIFPS